MKNNNSEITTGYPEQMLPLWERWLYAGFGGAFIMLLHAIIKAFENQRLTNAFFYLEDKLEAANMPGYNDYLGNLYFGMHSPLRSGFGTAVVILFIALAAHLAFNGKWRKVGLNQRLDLIFGFLLAGWIVLLSLGVEDPLNVGGGYSILVILYALGLGLGYWWLRRKKDKAEEVFP